MPWTIAPLAPVLPPPNTGNGRASCRPPPPPTPGKPAQGRAHRACARSVAAAVGHHHWQLAHLAFRALHIMHAMRSKGTAAGPASDHNACQLTAGLAQRMFSTPSCKGHIIARGVACLLAAGRRMVGGGLPVARCQRWLDRPPPVAGCGGIAALMRRSARAPVCHFGVRARLSSSAAAMSQTSAYKLYMTCRLYVCVQLAPAVSSAEMA